MKRVAILARRPAGFHVVAAKRAIELIDATQLLFERTRGLLLAVQFAVIQQRRPIRQGFVQDRLATWIVADRRTPPLMRDDVRDGPFQAVLDRRALFANWFGHVAHRRRIEVNVKGAGNRAQAGKLRTAHGRNQRRVDDADAFHRQWAKARKVNAQRVAGNIQDAPGGCFVIRPKDRTNDNVADLFLLRAQIAARDNRKVAQVLSREAA